MAFTWGRCDGHKCEDKSQVNSLSVVVTSNGCNLRRTCVTSLVLRLPSRGPWNPPPHDCPLLQFENESALNLYETCKVRTIKAGTLEKLVEYLVSAFKGNDSTYVTIFLCTYRAFATTKQVLDLLLNR